MEYYNESSERSSIAYSDTNHFISHHYYATGVDSSGCDIQSWQYSAHQYPTSHSGLPAYPSCAASTSAYALPYAHIPEYPQMVYPPTDDSPSPIQIHAPVPLSAYSTLLPPRSPNSESRSTPPSFASSDSATNHEPTPSPGIASENPLDRYMNAPQIPFPTPCDLLNEIAARDKTVPISVLSSEQISLSDSHATSKLEEIKLPRQDFQPSLIKKPENQRKAYFRAVAENVGFQPTDPDTITSHDKKRHYLECLEKYVLWLHDQLRLVGVEPAPLEQVFSYKGLNSRSIRTMLVHMQDKTRQINDHILDEEEKFVKLQTQVLSQQEAIESDVVELRRHSIASGAIPALAAAKGP